MQELSWISSKSSAHISTFCKGWHRILKNLAILVKMLHEGLLWTSPPYAWVAAKTSVQIKHNWNTLKTTMKYPWSTLKHPWNIHETFLKQSQIKLVTNTWNTNEAPVKHFLTTFQTILKHFLKHFSKYVFHHFLKIFLSYYSDTYF